MWLKEKRVFVAGTDTEVGKTYVSTQILKMYQKNGLNPGYFKPVATGGVYHKEKLISADVLDVIRKTSLKQDEELMNPVIYEIPAAPIISAELSGKPVSIVKIKNAYNKLCEQYESFVVEGIGGILVPITEHVLVIDLIKEFNLPVVVVTKPILGTINHTALTVRVLKDFGLNVLGLVVNNPSDVDPGISVTASFDILKRMTGLPVLKEFNFEMEW